MPVFYYRKFAITNFCLTFYRLEEHRTAEMLRTPLHEIALTVKLLGLGSIGDFLAKAIEPPPIDSVIEAEVLLRGNDPFTVTKECSKN